MRFEIEQKFRTPDHNEVARRLAELGANAHAPVIQTDEYLSHPSRDFAATNEALRLRTEGDRNAVTYKGPKHAGPTKTREEIEIAYEGGPQGLADMRRVFEALGFRRVAVIRKQRTAYHLRQGGRAVEVFLDVADGIGTFVEVETIADGDADLVNAQRAVIDLASTLGLTEPEPRSYLRMALESRAGGADA